MPRAAFTLVELLLVIAILFILVLVGSFSVQNAQARSKVSRVRVDLRTIATGLEMYVTDHASYPETGDTYMSRLTTPIAYCGGANAFQDQYPFKRLQQTGLTEQANPTFEYGYFDKPAPTAPPGLTELQDATNQVYKKMYGSYLLKAGGPHSDLPAYEVSILPANNGAVLIEIPYDPSNGVLSVGHVLRAQKK